MDLWDSISFLTVKWELLGVLGALSHGIVVREHMAENVKSLWIIKIAE